MDKWTRSFLDSGFSPDYQEVVKIIDSPKLIQKWVENHTDGMFGPAFGLSKIPEWLRLKPLLAVNFSPEATDRYRRICAASQLTTEIQIPVLYLLFRNWGFEEMKKYLDRSIKKGSSWSIYAEDWEWGMEAVSKVNLVDYSFLDEPSKLLIYVAAEQGGRISSKDLPSKPWGALEFFEQPTLADCVRYTLEDMKSSDLAVFLKGIGQKQAGVKNDRINHILDTLSINDIAEKLEISEQSYMQFSDKMVDRVSLCQAALFLYDISWAVYKLDFMYVNNISQINEAKAAGWGVRLHHYRKCPVHRKNVYKHSELDKINPIAHPDCDAAFLSDIK